jgi:hypothetical protein
MNLWLWKEELVPDFDTALARARAGAAYLDTKYGTGWDQVIDAEQLDISSPFRCVLGQLGKNGYFCLPSPQRAADCGFTCGLFLDLVVMCLRIPAVVRSYALLSEAWKVVLDERRPRVQKTHVRKPTNATAIATRLSRSLRRVGAFRDLSAARRVTSRPRFRRLTRVSG